MTHQERICALQMWGYSDKQSEFLVYAGLSSGYFLSRHLSGEFNPGFVDKMMRRGHVARQNLLWRAKLYHMRFAPMYELLGDPCNRNRQQHALSTAKTRVMGLDFLLNCGGVPLFTERERIEWFESHGVDRDLIPSVPVGHGKRFYFPDRYPVVIHDGVPVFAYIDSGAVSVNGFAGWLDKHGAMFAQLSRAKVVYVGSHLDFRSALTRRFDAAMMKWRPDDFSPAIRGMVGAFRLRFALERHNHLSPQEADEYRESSPMFLQSHIVEQYEQWKTDGVSALLDTGSMRYGVELKFQHLQHDYRCFGIDWGAARRRVSRSSSVIEGGEEPSEAGWEGGVDQWDKGGAVLSSAANEV